MTAIEQITRDVRFHQEKGRMAAREAVGHAIAIGELLVQGRKVLTPSQWSEWLAEEFGWSKRHGLRYCLLARRRSEVLARVGPEASLRSALQALAAVLPKRPPASSRSKAARWRSSCHRSPIPTSTTY